MSATSPTQRPATSHLSEQAGTCKISGQWLLEQPDDPPIRERNTLHVSICGQDGFGAIANDIRDARHSIDIVCWGFDPAMELERSGSQWPRGATFGELLAAKAAAGVRVRVLCWYDAIGADMPGAEEAMQRLAGRPRQTLGESQMYRTAKYYTNLPGMSLSEARRAFNAGWYEQVFAGELKGLSFRTRYMSARAASAGLEADPNAPRRGAIESFGLKMLATHHQKPIVIDYDLGDGSQAVGYVMGLNCVTDYWDTQAHLFDQPLRGAAWEGDGGDLRDLKPYQDYACRIRGEALAEVYKNFCDAWNRTRAVTKGGEGPAAVYTRQSGLAGALGPACVRAQIVRTQPEEKTEQSIRRLYQQASKFARKYIYVENQYFQYTPWSEQLKAERRTYRDKWKAGQGNYGRDNTAPPPMPWLHVIVVAPTPEKTLMVPRTHDTLKSLGLGESMPNQDKRIEDELKAHRESGRELSPLARDSQALGSKADIKKQLETLGMRTLAASLWTYDRNYRSTQKKDLATLDEWERTATRDTQGKDISRHSEATKALRDKLAAARYREIYIHSKLLMIDDGFFTLGSANLNQRSMASDGEINVATDNPGVAAELRQRVWALHTGGAEGCNPGTNGDSAIYKAFFKWEDLLLKNAERKVHGQELTGFLTPFHDDRSTSVRAG